MEEYLFKEEVYAIIGAAMAVHNEIGQGFIESVYHESLVLEMQARGIPVESEKQMDFFYKGHLLNRKYFVDLVCYGEIIVELKAVSELVPQHEAQLINYLHVSRKKVGVLINFGKSRLEYKRLVCSCP